MSKETSERVATIAGAYANVTGLELLGNVGNAIIKDELSTYLDALALHIRTLATSALSQRSDAK